MVFRRSVTGGWPSVDVWMSFHGTHVLLLSDQQLSLDQAESTELLDRRARMEGEHAGSEFAGCESRARTFIKLMATLDPLLASPDISAEDDTLHGDLHAVIEPDRSYVPQVQQWKSEVRHMVAFRLSEVA